MSTTLKTRAPLASLLLAILSASSIIWGHEQQLYLSRYVLNLKCTDADLTADAENTAYKSIFGEGDKDAHYLNGVSRMGELTVGPGGASATVSRPSEEYVLYFTEGNGTLIYGDQKESVRANDFLYLPARVKHGIANETDGVIKVLFMGYHLMKDADYKPKASLEIANADEVELQVLGSHGPTTEYKLLMDDTSGTRDRLASAKNMKSLFIMDFSPRGTNNPHRHASQEEAYFVMQGGGYMVAGVDAYGNIERHPSQVGDAFCWAGGTEVGFYSVNKAGAEHSIILAIRPDDPTKL